MEEDDNSWNMQITTSSQPVDNAISKIEELANSLIETVEYTEGLEENFQNLATSLVELESDRLRLHDELEVQTINASVKRHALKTRPDEYQRELNEAVLAARDGNTATIKALQIQMKRASEDTKKAVERQDVLQLENARFIPERDAVTKQHDEIIAALNQRMADKASKQIKLNETRDLLREASSGTEEYDLGLRNLKEDMEQFRAESEAEQMQLESDVARTQDAIVIQNQKNTDEKRNVDQLQDKIMDMEGRLDVVLKDVRRTENAKARLEMQSIQLEDTINREKLINQQTAEEVAVLEGARDKQRLGYQETIDELEKKIREVDGKFAGIREINELLSKEKDEAFLKKEESFRQKSKAQAAVRESAKEVQVIKRKTTALVEKAAHLSQDNTQAQESLMTLGENHGATIETFNQQILEYQANLDLEMTEKVKAQEEQEETEKTLDDFRTEQVRFMNDMTKKIEEGRKQHKILAQQSSKFNQSVASNVQRAGSLKVELEMAERGLVIMKKEVAMEIERLKTSIELYTSENEKKEQYLEDKKPVLKDLERELESTEEDYSRFKNEVVAVRNKQKSVQEQINRTQVLLNRLAKPYEKLKEDIKGCQEKSLGQLKDSAQDRKNQEAEIYDRTQKLENILEENGRFDNSCSKKEEMINEICMDIKAHGYYQEFLVKELRELQRRFMVAWDICVSMEKESAEQDVLILQGIDELQQETKDRCGVLTGISDSLNSEMERLTGFLENVNSRRPKDTRQEKRKSLKPTPPPTTPSLVLKHRTSTLFSQQSRRKLTLPTPPSQVVCYE